MVDTEIPRVALTLEQDRNRLAAAARTGDVVRVRRGAYCAPGDLRVDGAARGVREERNRALARIGALHAQLRAEHVFGHGSAALLLGCRVWRTPRETHVYQRYRPSGHASDDVRRHSWTLAPDDVTDAAGLRSPPWSAPSSTAHRPCTRSKDWSSPIPRSPWVRSETPCSRCSKRVPATVAG